MTTTLWAVSDLHAAVKLNGPKIAEIQPADPSDWLIVAGDVAERFELIVEVMKNLAERFDTGMLRIYERALDWSMHHRRIMRWQPIILLVLTVGLAVAVVAVGAVLSATTGVVSASIISMEMIASYVPVMSR